MREQPTAGIRSWISLTLNPGYKATLLMKQRCQLGHERLVRHIEAQRRPRNASVGERRDVGAGLRRRAAQAHIGDPVIGVAAPVVAGVDLQALLAIAPLPPDRHAPD